MNNKEKIKEHLDLISKEELIPETLEVFYKVFNYEKNNSENKEYPYKQIKTNLEINFNKEELATVCTMVISNLFNQVEKLYDELIELKINKGN